MPYVSIFYWGYKNGRTNIRVHGFGPTRKIQTTEMTPVGEPWCFSGFNRVSLDWLQLQETKAQGETFILTDHDYASA
jgi:hypothetical protein